ncbi:HNH endonuclease signature motif containing protein [Enteractinococcus fodinae]|uniref:HNH nuclease domain-containing protein n=1 Tax=Enteractinococcus fodinae TaxID=684663 RepID=A0ABU2AYH1_9MICC|nr:DUF222 domain-containing protein [Enteractinococcus fodinae]MDR7346405.1 hypothetical protein [Enteractinococcus fodinae]
METAVEMADLVQEFVDSLASLPPAASEEDNIDRLQHLERAKRALAAAQASATNAFVEQRKAHEAGMRITTSEQLKGIEAEVGLARGESPFVGAALTYTATALCNVLPNTYAALADGRMSEYHARIVAEQTSHLSDAHRREIDGLIAHRVGKASSSQLRKLIQGHAYRLDRKAAEQRAAQNQRDRRVCLDPGSDGISYLTAELPTHQAVAVMDALQQQTNKRLAAQRRDAANTPDDLDNSDAEQPLTRDQVMADLFVELLTGQTTADGVTAEVVVVMHDSSLFGDDDVPAWIPGHGPLPAGMVKHWLADPQAAKFFRRMYTRATDGQLVALESKRRHFPEGLSKMLAIRDDTCATPWCNSPVEDADHRKPWAKGGTTSWANATGLCKRCNQRKENRGWSYTGTPDRLTVTTPTGHQYTVPTRPPISQIRHTTTDPPIGPIDIAWPAAA